MNQEGSSLSPQHLETVQAWEQMSGLVNAIPGGVAVLRICDAIETIYCSHSLAAMTGYTTEEYRMLAQQDAAVAIYPEDAAMVARSLRAAAQSRAVAEYEFRLLHREGHIVWAQVQVKVIGEEGGAPLLLCMFHDISALKEARMELDVLVNSIPGGIAGYRVEGGRFIPTYFSDGVLALSGHERADFEQLVGNNALNIIYQPDRKRVTEAAMAALASGKVLDISYRVLHKDGSLVWVRLTGRRMGPVSESMRFYAVFTGMSAEARLFQDIANETANGIYVIDQKTYELLYANEDRSLFTQSGLRRGQKCYEFLHGRSEPCAVCALRDYGPDGIEHEITIEGTGRTYTARIREADWNGIPAYVQYIRDVTEEVNTRREKERLELYFKSVVENLPGGISVLRCESDGSLATEFVSDGFAAMLGMDVERVKRLLENDVNAGFHPEDAARCLQRLREYIRRGKGHCEITGRMMRGDGGYVWIKAALSLPQSADKLPRLYSVYTDVSRAMEEKEQLRRQYENLLLQHYHTDSPDELVLGHCNITRDRILAIEDRTGSELLETFGDRREEFFKGLSGLVVDEAERQAFLGMYLNAPALAAFNRHETEKILTCYVQLPKEARGRYVQFKVNLVETPDTGDITGVLTVTDVTEQTISDRILHQISVTNYDYVVDVNLETDSYTIVTCNKDAKYPPPPSGCYSRQIASRAEYAVAPKDRERYAASMDPRVVRQRLEREGSYTFSYCVNADKGDILTKNMTISQVDLRLGRVCLVCTDITESVREVRSLLNMMAYTFELMGFLRVGSGRFTVYTRQTVLENLPPHIAERYEDALEGFAGQRGGEDGQGEMEEQFRMDTILRRLGEQPSGYDFVFPHRSREGLRYKQINVLWGDENHSTVCMVRADVTDMLAAERKAKEDLELALDAAEEASRAKSDFLSAMSHDIRTPMNAIMGMTTLAQAHLDSRERVEDCLEKISISSRHLLSLINDILDMSKIEQSQISLNHIPVSLPELMEQLSAIILPQAGEAGLEFHIHTERVAHEHFYGDPLRISQILLNLLSNAVKFTPEGGRVDFRAEEVEPTGTGGTVRYRFTVKDTGIGMSQEFLATVFDPFARGRGVASVEGTGLGLSITKGLVNLMGGSITVESRPNEGSTFQVELECREAPERGTPCQKEAGKGGGSAAQSSLLAGRTFLIAEDNAINAEILCELLGMEGAGSVVKTDGVQVVEAFQKSRPGSYDAILMDIQMPRMDGYQATRAIRALQRPDARAVPIIAMTANAFSEDIQAALEAGMNAHVAKPLDMEVLRVTLAGALKG